MRAFGVIALICIAAEMSSTAKADGTCETIGEHSWDLIGTIKKYITCDMDSTVIDSKNFSITSGRDESVEAFSAYGNKQLEYLPNNLGAKFPSLLGLTVRDCSIRELSKDNFEGLGKLRELDFNHNQIEKIDDDTFEYIPALQEIQLANNKIKKLNGRAFASLHKLTWVGLSCNECIDEEFANATRIAELPGIVTGKCGFTEYETSPTILPDGAF